MTLPTPDRNKQIEILSDKFTLDKDQVTLILERTYGLWQDYTSIEEFLSLLAFGITYLKNYSGYNGEKSYEVLEEYLTITAITLNSDSKLLHLNQLGITGICDLDKANTELKKNIVSDVFGSRDVLEFLFALSADQLKTDSIFIKALEALASVPVS